MFSCFGQCILYAGYVVVLAAYFTILKKKIRFSDTITQQQDKIIVF